jgi:hypothetical protein
MRPQKAQASPCLINVLKEIAAAACSASLAESAFSTGDMTTAQRWHDDADRQCTTILGTICQLTTAEADAVEPAFTEVENRLSRLRRFLVTPRSSPSDRFVPD